MEELGKDNAEIACAILASKIESFTELYIRIDTKAFKETLEEARSRPELKTVKEIVFEIDGERTEITLEQLQSFLAMFYRAENEKEITID